MGAERFKLSIDELSYKVLASELSGLEDGDWGKPVIGQPRAMEALGMGTAIRARGYNLFVTGAPGTGRRTAVMRVLAERAPSLHGLKDYVYVYNFSEPQAPRALAFPSGSALSFKRDVHDLVENVKKLISMQSESGDFKKRKEEQVAVWEAEENSRLAAFEAELAADGFRVVQLQGEDGQTATDILPVRDGEPVSFDDLQSGDAPLPEAEFGSLRERYFGHMDRMRLLFVDLKRGRGKLETQLDRLRRDSIQPLIHAEAELLSSRHEGAGVRAWIVALERDILHHLYLFQPADDAQERKPKRPPLGRYGVNVLTDTSGAAGAPVIYETNPSYARLFGTIDQGSGGPAPDRSAYLKIRAGSLLRAAGGFLVMQAEDLVQDEEAWTALKRVLRSGKLEVQPQPGPYGPPPAIKPEPIDVDVKVILIGGELVYDVLYQADPDFQKLFKVCAEFDSTMPRNQDSLREYLAFIGKIVKDEGLRPPTPEGAAAVVEYGVRLSDYRHRLSTRFSRIADLLREADYRAGAAGRDAIDADAVDAAERARAWMSDLPEEKLADMIVSGEIILRVEGSCAGRVNGLAVHDRGYYAFGLPAVISAQVSPGESGVINIEGESGLSGEIYDKAVLIVEGFLRSRYARDFPLAVSASICFEQSYTAIEGDSASSTAVYALLSAIARVPLRQDLAVTGSVNQMGQIQPVGGVTEKVEGFFHICKRAGFTGTQGVLVPRQNVANLTLSREVMKAIEDGVFSVYAVSSIDEGIEVLTGLEAGRQDASGAFPEGSFNGRVAAELRRMADTVKEYLN
ncbi:MAG: AAA family ATPase [Spirochaetales bacterium]|nr:AAA family ATPase [Spirochaetales bacterium]